MMSMDLSWAGKADSRCARDDTTSETTKKGEGQRRFQEGIPNQDSPPLAFFSPFFPVEMPTPQETRTKNKQKATQHCNNRTNVEVSISISKTTQSFT
ncbi:hypothetical protein VTJ04DRAFT_8948 [Mycothermus thermophilus]|uniref:uncharacterized protein n=1 Tax=Humicola insolens TaxID=85995 RepID=UPI00374482B5